MTCFAGGIDENTFEEFCLALAIHIFGQGVQTVATGRNGGREVWFEGRFSYPDHGIKWNGYGVLLAMYRRENSGLGGAQWLSQAIRGELEQWMQPIRKRTRDDRTLAYLVIATNVQLADKSRLNSLDPVEILLARYADGLGLKGFALWDADKLYAFVDAYPAVGRRFTSLFT